MSQTPSPLPQAPDLITIKRGTHPVLVASNYIPASGELIGRINSQGFIDKIKCGDGIHKYIDLPFIGEAPEVRTGGIEEYMSKADFPVLGNDMILYVALDTRTLYYWDLTDNTYKEPKDLVGVPEAPSTGKKYARSNGMWSSIRELNIKGDIYTSTQAIEEYQYDFELAALEKVLTFKTITTKPILDCQVSISNTGESAALIEFREQSFKLYSLTLEPNQLQKYQVPINQHTAL